MTDQITVTQADIAAAQSIWHRCDDGPYCELPQWLVQAFARHRLATRTDATPAARKQFPILGSRGAKIDLQLVEDHGKQAYSNHYQTVERLAERGGLSWCELHAVLNNRPWQKLDENTAIAECRAIEARYLGAFDPPATDVAAVVEALQIAAVELEYFVEFARKQCEFEGDAEAGHSAVRHAFAALAPFTKGQP